MKKFNPITRFFVNRFDFLFRFLYCKIGLFRLAGALSPRIYSSNYKSLDAYFRLICKQLTDQGFDIRGKSVLEIGPGNSLINAYNFLNAGARRVVLIDKYPRTGDSRSQRAYLGREIRYFKEVNNVEDVPYVDRETLRPDPEHIRFIEGDLADTRFDERFDLVFSIAVLHHIKDLPRYMRRMGDILNSGGMAFHAIDLKDKLHFFGNPFLFYKYSDFMWERFLTEESMTYTNRVRYGEYIDLFAANGFELVWKRVNEYDVPDIRLDPRFAGRDDLRIGDAQLLLRKK